MAVLGPRFCLRAFSSCGKRGPLFIAVRRPLTTAASLVADHRLQTRRLSSCGSRAQPLRGMWDLPRPGLEPVSPALAGRLSTTVPPAKPYHYFLLFKLCWLWPLRASCLFSMPSSFLLCGTTDTPGSSCVFPAPALESTTSPRSPGSFYWRMVFRNQNLGTRCDHGC